MKPNQQNSLSDWLDWLLALHAQEIDLGLERVKQVAQVMNLLSPQAQVITVAGTNGKGSSVAMLNAIYRVAGYNVGAYTSPHLLRFNERIQVNGKPVIDQLIIDAFCEIESARGTTKLTYFEFATLASLVIFKQTDLDVIILEVGIGGRLDAVNIIDANRSLITAIGIDHVEWLGSDINKAAVEKAGIMRSGNQAICSDPNVPHTLIDYATKHKVPLKRLGKDFSWALKKLKNSKNYQAWSFTQADFCLDNFCLNNLPLPALKGNFQIQNAAGVVAVVLSLLSELAVTDAQISQGLTQAKHSGRLQTLVVGEQNWLLDVAHNPHSANVLAEYLSQQNKFFEYAVFAVLQDKDALPMVKSICPYVKYWMIADLNVPRAMSVSQLTSLLKSAGVMNDNIKDFDSIATAVAATTTTATNAVLQSKQKSQAVLSWGSFFTVSQTMAVLNV